MYKNISERLKKGHVVDSLYLDDVVIKFHGSIVLKTSKRVIRIDRRLTQLIDLTDHHSFTDVIPVLVVFVLIKPTVVA